MLDSRNESQLPGTVARSPPDDDFVTKGTETGVFPIVPGFSGIPPAEKPRELPDRAELVTGHQNAGSL